MSKYMNKPALSPGQELEIFPILDAALALSFGKAIVNTCSASRADYLARILNGERNRNGIESISTYLPDDPLYGKGLYYNLVIETHPRGLIVAHVLNPPPSLTWLIIECAATKQPIDTSQYKESVVKNRLKRLKERYEVLLPLYYDNQTMTLRYAMQLPEEMAIVDIDVGNPAVMPPTAEQRAKARK